MLKQESERGRASPVAFSSASDVLAAEIRADNDNYTTQETGIGSRKLHGEVATQPNANFNLLTLLLHKPEELSSPW